MATISLPLTTVCITFFQLTDINTCLLDLQGKVLMAHIRDHLPEFLLKEQQHDWMKLCREANEDPEQCVMLTNEWGLSYLSRRFEMEDEADAKVLILGPFLIQTPDVNSHTGMEQRKHMELEEFYRGLKLISTSKMHSIVNILEHAGTFRQASFRYVETTPQTARGSAKTNVERILEQTDEESTLIIDVRYKMEKEMMRAVETGDKEAFRKLHAKISNLYDFSERFPNQPIRTMRNSLIILNTLFRISAERGKVQPFFLHQISEKFAKQIERFDTIHSLTGLMDVMVDEYCDLVRDRAKYGFSLVVQKAAEYLTVHFSKPLNLQHLASLCAVHPTHLSRQFKKETGMTLTDFQQKQRIEEAKVLLKTSPSSIGWIASYVGFDDAGYFGRVFHKLEGTSPSDYRKFH